MSPNKILWMIVGLPRSGKTTCAQGRIPSIPIVNPDAIRLALHGQKFQPEAEPMVWAIAKYMVVALFEAGHNDVMLDATNTTRKRRDAWVDPRWSRVFVMVDTPKETCIARAQETCPELIPVIERMAEQYEPPSNEEIMEWEKLR